MTQAISNPGVANSPPGRRRPQLGDLLVARGLINREQLEKALQVQAEGPRKTLLGKLLVDLGFVSPEGVTQVLADSLNIPFSRIVPEMVSPEAVALIPTETLEEFNVLPISVEDNRLTVAVEDFSNIFLLEELGRMSGMEIHVIAAIGPDIRNTREICGRGKHAFALDNILSEIGDTEMEVIDEQEESLDGLAHSASDSPVIKLVNYIIYAAVQDGASDIHIEPDDGFCRVRYRIDGDLQEKTQPPMAMHPALVSRIKILAEMDVAERRKPQDGAISMKIDKHGVDLRVSTLPSKFGEKVVMRVIDKRNAMVSLDQLGFALPMLESVRRAIHQPNGIFLVTGPTGSGKSTTLYAALSEIVSDKINVSTVEDPVEFNLPNVNQFQVNNKAQFTFATALRALLRQDPDIIMVGEIRDNETASIAVQAALTGHMVFSTLHTNDSASAVTRLVNMGIEPFLVAACLRGVLAQRLARRICPECKESTQVSPTTREILRQQYGEEFELDEVFEGKGCSNCRNTGSRGRVGVYELLTPSSEMLQAIARGESLQDLRHLLTSDTYVPLISDGIEKARNGLIREADLIQLIAH